jgi:ribose transport system substrate-binding protein
LEANKAGVKIINVDSGLNFDSLAKQGGKIVCYIGSDNVQGGQIAGQAMGEFFKGQAGPIEVGIIEGLPGHVNAMARKKGFLDAIAAYSNVKVVASQTANWDMNQGYQVMQNMMQSHPYIKAVFGSSDQMSLGAIAAIKDAGKKDQVTVFSFDATTAGLQAVQEGTMYGTVAQYPTQMGYMSVQTAINVLTNPGSEVQMPPKIFTKVLFITKDNIEQADKVTK